MGVFDAGAVAITGGMGIIDQRNYWYG